MCAVVLEDSGKNMLLMPRVWPCGHRGACITQRSQLLPWQGNYLLHGCSWINLFTGMIRRTCGKVAVLRSLAVTCGYELMYICRYIYHSIFMGWIKYIQACTYWRNWFYRTGVHNSESGQRDDKIPWAKSATPLLPYTCICLTCFYWTPRHTCNMMQLWISAKTWTSLLYYIQIFLVTS